MCTFLQLISASVRLLAAATSALITFGYLFFLSTQSALTTSYAFASILALGLLAFTPRHLWKSATGFALLIGSVVIAGALTAAKIYEDLTFYEGPELSAAGFRFGTVLLMLVGAGEAWHWRRFASGPPDA
jgi:hypothetical protein